MASYLARQVRITYGTLVIGDATDQQPMGQVQITKSDAAFSVTFEFVYSVPGLADPGAAFETQLAVIDAALRDREQDLLIEYGAGLAFVLLDLTTKTDTQNTALNVRCEWSRTDNSLNTNRSAHYSVRITGELPPSDAARDGRRTFDQQVSLDGSRRLSVLFSGEWTRVGVVSASAGYLAGIDLLVSTYFTNNFSGPPALVLELLDEVYTPDEEDDVCGYSRSYREILVPQTGAGTGVLGNPNFTDQTLVITRSRREGAGPDGESEPLVALTAILTTKVNRELNTYTNVGITRLDELVETEILPAVVLSMQEVVGGQTVAVLSVVPDFDPTTNQLRVAIEAVSKPGGNLLERVIFTQDNSQSNTILRKAYQNGTEQDQPVPTNGANLFDQPLVKIPRAWVFTTAGAVVRRITDTQTLLGTSRFASGGGGGAGGQSPAGAGANGSAGGGTRERGAAAQPAGASDAITAIMVGRQFGIRNSIRGLKGLGTTIAVVEVVSVIDLELYAPITASSSSGGNIVASSVSPRTGGSAGSES